MFIKGLGFGLGFFVAKVIMDTISYVITDYDDLHGWSVYLKNHDLRNCNIIDIKQLHEEYEKEKETKESKTGDKTIGF